MVGLCVGVFVAVSVGVCVGVLLGVLVVVEDLEMVMRIIYQLQSPHLPEEPTGNK